MDPLYNLMRSRPIETGREMSMEPYPNREFRFIDNQDHQFGSGSVPTRTRFRSDGPDLLLTLPSPPSPSPPSPSPPSSSPPSSSPPSSSPPSPSPPSPSPPSQSPALGSLLFDYSSTKSCNTLLPAKPIPPLPACSQWSHCHPYQRGQIQHYPLAPSEARLFEMWEWEFHRYQLATSEARFSERWEWAFHCYQRRQMFRSESDHGSATSLHPAKPDLPLPPCSHWSNIVRMVKVSMSE